MNKTDEVLIKSGLYESDDASFVSWRMRNYADAKADKQRQNVRERAIC
jgi:hypothetical protein